MTPPLLDRQFKLVEFLTSAEAIFGSPRADGGGPLGAIDCGMLRLEAQFSYRKRVDKIASTLPRTLNLIKARVPLLLQEFAVACPPVQGSSFANAQQFCGFLSSQTGLKIAALPYLSELADCELACAEVAVSSGRGGNLVATNAKIRIVRRSPSVRLQRCAYNIRPIYEDGVQAEPARRPTLLAISKSASSGQPMVSEVSSAVFELLGALGDWIELTQIGETAAVGTMIRELTACGLVEVMA